MEEVKQYLEEMLAAGVNKIIISKPQQKTEPFRKIVVEKKERFYQIAKYTEKQVFHENLDVAEVAERCRELIEGRYRQVNGMAADQEHMLLISVKGACRRQIKKRAEATVSSTGPEHNRRKNYILPEGTRIEPLVDMGIFTEEGRVVRSMYDKYKQINRFIEILDDEISAHPVSQLNVIDFGCGKSYLTFLIYYYLTEVKHMTVRMIGLDLKADVIAKCNAAAKKYHYDGLHFELGDINGYTAPFDVDMVVTLHACDTATDYALYNAIGWKARMIFSVPCCQHELNRQMAPRELGILARYGIVKERFAALATDALRANLLEYCGYKTQLLEFVDLEHTPKNLLIRAVRQPIRPAALRTESLAQVRELMQAFAFRPTLYRLMEEDGRL